VDDADVQASLAALGVPGIVDIHLHHAVGAHGSAPCLMVLIRA